VTPITFPPWTGFLRFPPPLHIWLAVLDLLCLIEVRMNASVSIAQRTPEFTTPISSALLFALYSRLSPKSRRVTKKCRIFPVPPMYSKQGGSSPSNHHNPTLL
jgi:hypothetical protein